MSWLDDVEARALVRLQRQALRRPVTTAAHLLSSAGEHGWVWFAGAAVGAATDRRRRARWGEVGLAALAAHAAAVVLKRILRRQRPSAAGLRILDATPSRLSCPSAHAASTTAAAVAAAPLVGAALTAPLPVAMAGARMVLGVHYPTDVALGAVVGVAGARLVRRGIRGRAVMKTAGALVRAIRPRQWVKNVLVLAAPAAAGQAITSTTVTGVVVAFAAFCLAASGVYLVNDVRDVEEDRQHPTKRFRPIAAGELPVPVALGTAAVLLAAAIALPLTVDSTGDLWIVLAVYVVVQLAYCLWLKHQRVIDLVVVSSGFLLRAVAGGVACGLPLSQWFLLVAAFGSLFMVAGKRYSEKRLHSGSDLGVTRKSLEEYSEPYLRFVWTLAAGMVLLSYSLWAFELSEETGSPLPAISIAPLVIAVLRYAVDVDRGEAGAPEDIVLRDGVLQLVGLVWLLTFVATVVIR